MTDRQSIAYDIERLMDEKSYPGTLIHLWSDRTGHDLWKDIREVRRAKSLESFYVISTLVCVPLFFTAAIASAREATVVATVASIFFVASFVFGLVACIMCASIRVKVEENARRFRNTLCELVVLTGITIPQLWSMDHAPLRRFARTRLIAAAMEVLRYEEVHSGDVLPGSEGYRKAFTDQYRAFAEFGLTKPSYQPYYNAAAARLAT